MHTKASLVAAFALVASTVCTAQAPSIPTTSNATRATTDDSIRTPSNTHAMWFDTGELFNFESTGRFTQDAAAGTANLVGRLVSTADPRRAFDANVTFGGLTNTAPSGSPKVSDLFPGALASNGGPIDPGTWYYYTSITGGLNGIRDYAGARLTLTRRGTAFQVGYGASVKNQNYGASGWFNFNTASQPTNGMTIPSATGDFNIDLLPDCVTGEGASAQSGFWPNSDSSAFNFAALGCGDAYDFIAPAYVASENAAGIVRITGEIAARANPNCRFAVDIEMSSRVLPGATNYPPAGSPKTLFPSSFLTVNGGPIDPDAWVYYNTISGSLSGRGDLAGARANVSLTGCAAQFGFGASRRIEDGAQFEMNVNVTQQPNSGPALSNTTTDGNLVFAVGALPILEPDGGSRQKLQTVTDRCFILTGCGLDMVTQVNFGSTTITSQDPCDLGRGYFEIRSSTEICVYPPLCLAEGSYRITAQDGAGQGGGRLTVNLEDPLAPTMVTNADLQTGKTQRYYIHQGVGPNTCPGASITYLILSSSPAPTFVRGFVNAQLGAQGSSYLCGPGFTNNGCIEIDGYPIPPSFAGTRLYYQSIFLCMPNVILPVPITNRVQTDYR